MAALVFMEIAAETPRYSYTWEDALRCNAFRWFARRAGRVRASANPESEAALKIPSANPESEAALKTLVLTPRARLH